MMRRGVPHFLFCPVVLAVLLMPAPVVSDTTKEEPSIAVIIDDMGDKLSWGKKAVALPGKVTLSFLPHSPHSTTLANKAYASGKEIMLHLPMQTESGKRLGPGGLTLHMTEGELKKTAKDDLESIPHVKGINNHMGSLLTRHPGAMEWLMQVIKAQGELYFVDSRTTAHSVAGKIAAENELPTAGRDVFLDDVRDKKAIRKEFRRLLTLARKHGSAIGIGHPYPETLEVLRKEISKLDSKGIRLIPASQLVAIKNGDDRRHNPLTDTHMVVKRLQQEQQ